MNPYFVESTTFVYFLYFRKSYIQMVLIKNPFYFIYHVSQSSQPLGKQEKPYLLCFLCILIRQLKVVLSLYINTPQSSTYGAQNEKKFLTIFSSFLIFQEFNPKMKVFKSSCQKVKILILLIESSQMFFYKEEGKFSLE